MLVTLLAVALLRLCATNDDLPPVSTKAHPRGRLLDRTLRLEAPFDRMR
jgi:hypothetical protein